MGHLYKRQQWSLISDGVPNQHHHQWDPRPGQFKMGPRLHQDAPWCAESCGNCEYLQQWISNVCSLLLYILFQFVNILGFICVMCASPYYKEQAVGEWFVFVSMTAFWVSLVFLVMYLIHAMEKFHVIPWLMIEFGFCGLWTFFYFSEHYWWN